MSEHDSEQSLARLLKLSGERDAPSAERMAQARMAVRESWQRMLVQSRMPVWRRNWLKISFTLAAGLVCLLVMPRNAAPPSTVVVARVAAVEGEVSVTVGAKIHVGQQLVTENGRVALALGDSLSLRIDQHTRLRLDAVDHVTLLEGMIYVDSGGLSAQTQLGIATPAGEVRHLGTQFLVSVKEQITRVRVREGRVQLSPRHSGIEDHSMEHIGIAAGEELQVVGSQSLLQHGLSTYGADWEWSAMIAPPFDIENRPLAEFLAWIAREHGWQLQYTTQSLQQRTHEIRLHGSFDRMGSSGVMERISLVTGVPLAARDGVLIVGDKEVNR